MKKIIGLLCLVPFFLQWSCSRYSDATNPLYAENLYKTRCSNCHQIDGKGLASLYPPLLNSDFLNNDHAKVICLVYNGAKGEMSVNGKSYNQVMPANTDLSEEALAAITTYIYQKFAQQSQTNIIPLEVQQALSQCK